MLFRSIAVLVIVGFMVSLSAYVCECVPPQQQCNWDDCLPAVDVQPGMTHVSIVTEQDTCTAMVFFGAAEI